MKIVRPERWLVIIVGKHLIKLFNRRNMQKKYVRGWKQIQLEKIQELLENPKMRGLIIGALKAK